LKAALARGLFALGAAQALWPSAAAALSAGADFLRAEIPARPAAMGGSFAAYHDDATAFLWNPAALGHVREPTLSATHFSSIVDTTFDQASFVQPLSIMGTPGGLGLGVQYSSTANLFETDLQGNDKGVIDNHDFVVQTGYGFMLTPRFSMGLGAKVFSSQLAEFKSRGLAVDLGVQSVIIERLDLGVSFVHLGIQEAYDSQSDPLPALLRMALKGVLVDTREVMIQAALGVDRPWTTSDPIVVSTGAEYWYQRSLAFRVGWRFGADTGNFTIGTGVKWFGLGFDYAYIPMGDIGITHRFTANAELGKVFEKAKLFVPDIGGPVEAPPAPTKIDVDPALR
jgi:hypothetical protein